MRVSPAGISLSRVAVGVGLRPARALELRAWDLWPWHRRPRGCRSSTPRDHDTGLAEPPARRLAARGRQGRTWSCRGRRPRACNATERRPHESHHLGPAVRGSSSRSAREQVLGPRLADLAAVQEDRHQPPRRLGRLGFSPSACARMSSGVGSCSLDSVVSGSPKISRRATSVSMTCEPPRAYCSRRRMISGW